MWNPEPLTQRITGNRTWLARRGLQYGHEREYARCKACLEETWRTSVSRLAEAILVALSQTGASPEASPAVDFAQDPMAAFGVREARRYRLRGGTPNLFLGLMSYCELGYLDLAAEADPRRDAECEYETFIHGCFERVEFGFCEEWLSE